VRTDFADAFAVMGEAGFVPGDLVPDLQDMARLRNLLVHGYALVDDNRVVQILHTRLKDVEAFRRSVASRLVTVGASVRGPAPIHGV
jgi:uncharacterized protein YutE (UPF0331/DUF86 family)